MKTEVKVFENEKEAEVAEANAELAKKKAGWAQQAQVAEVVGTLTKSSTLGASVLATTLNCLPQTGLALLDSTKNKRCGKHLARTTHDSRRP